MKRLCLAGALALVTLSCGSPNAPAAHRNGTAVYLSLGPDSVSQGDTASLGISFTQGDTPGDPLYLQIAFDGGPPAIDTLTVPPLEVSSLIPQALSGGLIIPAGLPDGRLTITVVLPKEGDSASATINVKDTHAPIIGGAFIIPGVTPNALFGALPSYANVIDFVAGGTDSLDISVYDNHSIAWIGWAFGPPSNVRDSVAIAGPVVQAPVPFTVPMALAGTTPSFTVFARDSDGNMAVDSFGQVNIASYVHHPVRTVAVDSIMTDIAYDAKRNVLYLSEAGHANVLVLSLASMTFQSPIVLPAPPAGLDLTPGGDTLVVALANTSDLAFVTLAGTQTISVVQLTSLDSIPGDSTTAMGQSQSVRVAADGRVIVEAVRLVQGGLTGNLVDLNLTTGLNEIAFPNSFVALARSADASRVLISGVISYSQSATLYDAASHQYLTPSFAAGAIQAVGIFLSANQNGTAFLEGNTLVDANLNVVGVVTADNVTSAAGYGNDGYGAAISWNGTDVWLGGIGRCLSSTCTATSPGFYFRFRVPATVRGQEGQLIEVADAPESVTELVVLPGDQTLVAVGIKDLMAFDLTTSTPGPVASRVAGQPRAPRPKVIPRATGGPFDIRLKIGRTMRTFTTRPPAV